MAINLTVALDNEEAVRKLHELQKAAKTTTSRVVKDSEQIDAAWNKMKNTLGGIATAYSFQSLARQVVQVRGEVQQLEIAFETMLGSKAKADALMSEMMTLAAATPFGLQDVTGAAKQLLAFGSTSEEVAKEITMLGDIAAGMSIPLNDMIYLYGTTRTQGRLFTQDLRQFMGRGIPLAEELAKQFDVTKDKVGELVTAGKVGFPEVQKALEAMTSDGGKFGGLMEKQAQSVAGQVSALEDAMYQMFNEIGESSEGFISAVLSGASWVVEHYEAILNILGKVIIAYGTYKATLIFIAAKQKLVATAQFAQRLYNVAKGAQTAAQAFRVLNTAMKSNLWGLVLSVLATIGAVIWDMCSATDEATDSTEALSRELGELEQAERDEYIEVQKLAYEYEHVAKTEEERLEVLKKLKDINPDIVDGVDALSGAYDQLTKNVEAYCEQQLKSIQLASLTDKQNDAIKRQAEAMAEEASILAALPSQLIELKAQMDNGTYSFKNIKLAHASGPEIEVTDDMKKSVFDEMKEYLDSAEITKENAKGIAEYLAHVGVTVLTPNFSTSASSTGNSKSKYEFRDHDSFDSKYNFEKIVNQLNNAQEQAEEAKKDLEIILRDMPEILNILGLDENPFEGEGGDGADAAMKYVDALRAAREAYLREQREFAALKNNPEATETEYFAAEEELKTAKEAYEKLGGVTKQATTDAEKQRKEAAKRMQQLEYDSQQAIIDIMAEGTDKKLAQLDLDYKKRMNAIAEQEAELLAKQGSLPEEQAAMFKNIRTGAANDYANAANEALFGDTDEAAKAAFDKLKADEKAWNQYLAEYGTFQERLKALTIKYNEEIAAAQNDAERKRLENERDAILAEYEEQASAWAAELVDKSTVQLNKMITELQAEVEAKQAAFDALDSSDSATAQQYREEINKLNAQIKLLEAQLKKAQKATENKDWDAAAEVFQGISAACDEAASALEGVEGGLASTFQNMAKVADVAASLVSAIYTVATASGALNAALGVIGLIAAAIQAVGTFISMLGDEYTLEDTIYEAKELNTELERMRKLAQINSIEGTIFGENPFGNFQNNLRVMREALEEFGATQEDIINRGEEYWKTINEGEAGEFKIRAVKDRSWEDIEESIRNMQVKTRDRSGAAEFFGAEDEYANLGDIAPEIFVDGKVTLEGLQKLKDSNIWEKLTQENRDLIDEMISDWERYEEATDAVKDYLTDIFGELGGSIADSLVSAFESGTDAAEAMGDAFSEVIERMARDMVLSTLIHPLLEDAQNSIDDLTNKKGEGKMTDEEYIAGLMDVGANLVDGALAQQESANAFLGALDKRMAELGYENAFDGEDEQSASSGGFQAMSQDTGSELNGRFTDIQGKVSGINEAVQFIKSQNIEQLQYTQSISQTIAMIHNDTSLIEKHTRVLGQMSEDIARMRSAIDNGEI